MIYSAKVSLPQIHQSSIPESKMVVSSKKQIEPTLGVKFVSAGLAACIGDAVTFPLDTAKVRLQIQGEGTMAAAAKRGGAVASLTSMASQQIKYRGMTGTLATISKEEGVRALYNGLAPGLQRQLAFASIRIGLYDSVKQFYMNFFRAGSSDKSNVPLRIMAGITTGGLAVAVAQPADVVKVRLQAQTGRGTQRYAGCLDAYRSIARGEGIGGLWKGAYPNIARNAIVNACEMVSYDMIKTKILSKKLMSDNMPCHIVSGFGAGFVTTLLASPVDVVKTRYMNSAPGKYSGAFNCALVMAKDNGLSAFYKGFMPSFMRLGSWNIVMFVSYEQLKRLFAKRPRTKPPSQSTISLNNASAALIWRV